MSYKQRVEEVRAQNRWLAIDRALGHDGLTDIDELLATTAEAEAVEEDLPDETGG